MEKNDAQISRVTVLKKEVLEKNLPNPSYLFVQTRSRKQCAEIWVSRYYLSDIFWFRETVNHHKNMHKTRSTKNQEDSAHRFGDNYLTKYLVKFLQDRIKNLMSWSF